METNNSICSAVPNAKQVFQKCLCSCCADLPIPSSTAHTSLEIRRMGSTKLSKGCIYDRGQKCAAKHTCGSWHALLCLQQKRVMRHHVLQLVACQTQNTWRLGAIHLIAVGTWNLHTGFGPERPLVLVRLTLSRLWSRKCHSASSCLCSPAGVVDMMTRSSAYNSTGTITPDVSGAS